MLNLFGLLYIIDLIDLYLALQPAPLEILFRAKINSNGTVYKTPPKRTLCTYSSETKPDSQSVGT